MHVFFHAGACKTYIQSNKTYIGFQSNLIVQNKIIGLAELEENKTGHCNLLLLK